MELTNDILVSNFTQYERSIQAYIGQEEAESIIKAMGGSDAIMHATFYYTADSGLAYDGAFIHNTLKIAAYAVKINEMLPKSKQVDKNSLLKACFISTISRPQIFEPNDSTWEMANRGFLYKYSNLEGSLRMGERSILIAMNCGIKLTPTEFEAIRIMDLKEDDFMAKSHSSIMSMLIKHAYEIILTISRVDKK